MKFLDRIAKRFTKSASTEVKKEAKKTLIDLIPGVLAIGTMIVGMLVFHETDGFDSSSDSSSDDRATITNTKIITNNYFFKEASDDMIKKLLGKDDE